MVGETIPLHAADLAAGREKAELCVGCHGEAGISSVEYTPSLAGQPDLFVQWQLIFFRSGTRQNALMRPIVEALSNEDIRNLGAYYASLPPMRPRGADADPELSRKGAEAAAGRRCGSCHTDSFAGVKATARIAGQREEYLIKALNEFKSGQRSGGGMAAMADVAYSLSEVEISALAHYLAHFSAASVAPDGQTVGQKAP
ncbi:c-type cytochrome [Rhodopseudomonas sp.]|uniref:c-type cytochrome n=1 Tax=Rhodopseudomonas sp. TaxID=1078 RepID=UPI0039C9A2B1